MLPSKTFFSPRCVCVCACVFISIVKFPCVFFCRGPDFIWKFKSNMDSIQRKTHTECSMVWSFSNWWPLFGALDGGHTKKVTRVYCNRYIGKIVVNGHGLLRQITLFPARLTFIFDHHRTIFFVAYTFDSVTHQ